MTPKTFDLREVSQEHQDFKVEQLDFALAERPPQSHEHEVDQPQPMA